jgi:hypothetical protein
MTTISRRLAMALLATCLAGPAAAQTLLTGSYYIEHCRNALAETGTYIAGTCTGMILGILFVGRNLPLSARLCTPPDSTNKQALRVVVSFLDANPHRLHEPFGDLVIDALRTAWPCRAVPR